MIAIYVNTENPSEIKLSIEGGYPVKGWDFYFSLQCNSKAEAQLLADNLVTTLHKRIEEVRRESYNKGWSDAKKGEKKETWFSTRL